MKQIRTSLYHPQTNKLVGRFNQTMQRILRCVVDEDSRNWDLLLLYVLFAVCERPQASISFMPFELLFGRRPRGLLDMVKEAWKEQPSPCRTTIEHICEMQEHIEKITPIICQHMLEA